MVSLIVFLSFELIKSVANISLYYINFFFSIKKKNKKEKQKKKKEIKIKINKNKN